jgi:hypothetical protein
MFIETTALKRSKLRRSGMKTGFPPADICSRSAETTNTWRSDGASEPVPRALL